MTDATESPMYEVIWRTRRLFQQLRAAADALHADSDITASQRAVLEFLSQQQPQTVPHMAREKSVSRQHIQHIVNELLARGLVETITNPSHKRSSLIRLTHAGSRLFDAIRSREAKLLEGMGKQFNEQELRTTAQTLQAIDEYLQQASQRRERPDNP